MSRPLPDVDDVSRPFWDACRDERLVVQACADCGATRYPPRPVCPACRSWSVDWREARGTAVVDSYTVVHPPVLRSFESLVPYAVVLVSLEEGVRMVGRWLADGTPKIGATVRVAFEDVDDMRLPGWVPA